MEQKEGGKIMDNQIKGVLEAAGWYPGRSIDIDYMLDDIKRLGYGIPGESVMDLFREFWNLELIFTMPNGEWGSVRLNIDVAEYYSDYMAKDILAVTSEEKIFPVGTINEGTADLIVSDKSKFYMAHESGIFLVGNDFMDALDSIIYQKDILRIR